MKADSPDIDKEALAHLLQSAYGVDVARFDFVPKGEESYSYIVTTNIVTMGAERKYFVKVHLASISPALEADFHFVHDLSREDGFEWVVGPYATNEGKYLVPFGKYAVALFDYVAGKSIAPSALSGQQMERFAALVAKLHRSVALAGDLTQETYAIPFKAWLMEVLEAVDQPLRKENVWSQRAYNLIHAEKSQILAALAYTEEIATLLQASEQKLSVTHGDLASFNILQNEHAAFFVVDWSKVRVAPAARDLVDLWEEGNAPLLFAYFHAAGDCPASFKEVVTYYLYHNLLAMITDYGSWLILEDASPEEADNAWRRLQEALPLDAEKIQSKVEAICEAARLT